MTRLVLITPNGLYRVGISVLLRNLGFDDVIGFSSIEDITQQSGSFDPIDIALIDVSLEAGPADALVQRLRKVLPLAKIVLVGSELSLDALLSCLKAGGSGYILANVSPEELQKSLHLVSVGGTVFPPEIVRTLSELARSGRQPAVPMTELHECGLSERELEILRRLVVGDPNKVIAQQLNITEATVKVHVKHILRKTNACNRTQAALWAVAKGITAVGLASFGVF